MRTTVRLEPNLLAKAKREAARRGTTLTALIEQGLLTVLHRPHVSEPRTAYHLPISVESDGLQAGVDLDDSSDVLDLMDDRR